MLEAICWDDTAGALSLLQRPQLLGLNEVDENEFTSLHRALFKELPEVALAILARADFHAVNAKDLWGRTALHLAACFGFPQVCRAIVGRADFVQLRAVGDLGYGSETALQVARRKANRAVAEFLEAAEVGRA